MPVLGTAADVANQGTEPWLDSPAVCLGGAPGAAGAAASKLVRAATKHTAFVLSSC
jgi:hypothetical protein